MDPEYPTQRPNEVRLALFVASMRAGGAERVILNLARGFRERGLAVDLVLASAEGPYLEQVPPGVRVIDLGARRVIASLPELVRYLRAERPSALISAVNHVNLVALWARRLAGVPTRVVVTLHNTLSSTTQNAWNRRQRAVPLLMRRFFPWADAIIAVSSGVADDFTQVTGIDASRVRVVYNPVVSREMFERAAEPAEHPWFTPGQPPVVLGVGRLAAQKRFGDLLRAFALLKERSPARLVILGEGRERGELEALTRTLGLEDHVDMPGFVANPYAYLARAGAFALSSAWEGLPTVLIEALALGTPIVSTDCRSGPREILQGGEYGRLVPVGDPPGLAEALLEALQEPRAAHGTEAYAPFTYEASVDAYLVAAGVAEAAA